MEKVHKRTLLLSNANEAKPFLIVICSIVDDLIIAQGRLAVKHLLRLRGTCTRIKK
jgi:hypothetical protein